MHADDSNLKFSASSQEELELEAYKKWTKIKQFLDKNILFLKVGRLNFQIKLGSLNFLNL